MSMMSVEEAYDKLIGDAAPLSCVETVPLAKARGRVLAGDVVATRTQPSFDASAMDGYAVRARDCAEPFEPLRKIGESAAGRAFGGKLAAGECVRIFTGAPVPPGADAILIQEDARVGAEGDVVPTQIVNSGQHIRPAGIDFSAGDVLIPAGTRLSPGAIALAASGGHPTLAVLARPRVAILATGDELVLPGEAVGPSQIVASNTFGVAAMVEAAGGEPIDCGIAGDDIAEIDARLQKAIADGADVVVTIGGASVGDHDLVGTAFAARGVELDFWKVAMRPGKPLMAGRLGDARVVGLPGNPASSMVAATLFLAPLVQKLAGLPITLLRDDAALGVDVKENGARADFIRARIERASSGEIVVFPLDRQDSSLLSIYATAEVLLVRDPHAPPARKGERCRVIRLD